VITGESVPKNLIATAYAILICIGELLGGTIGPAAGGAMADASHSLYAPIFLSAGLAAVALIMSFFVKETAPHRLALKNDLSNQADKQESVSGTMS
jgi:MFS family permease